MSADHTSLPLNDPLYGVVAVIRSCARGAKEHGGRIELSDAALNSWADEIVKNATVQSKDVIAGHSDLDLTNHHNAAKCPYCSPDAEQANDDVSKDRDWRHFPQGFPECQKYGTDHTDTTCCGDRRCQTCRGTGTVPDKCPDPPGRLGSAFVSCCVDHRKPCPDCKPNRRNIVDEVRAMAERKYRREAVPSENINDATVELSVADAITLHQAANCLEQVFSQPTVTDEMAKQATSAFLEVRRTHGSLEEGFRAALEVALNG